MYPREHAVVSGAAVLLAGLYLGTGAEKLALWLAIGTAAGVLIDLDHIPLAMWVNGKVEEGFYWMRHPLKAFLHGEDAHMSLDPEDNMILHRLVSHLAVLLAVLMMLPYHTLVLPVAVGLSAHIAADVAWDIYIQDGFPYI